MVSGVLVDFCGQIVVKTPKSQDFEIWQFANSYWTFMLYLHKNVFPFLFTFLVLLLYVFIHWSDTFRVLVDICGQKVVKITKLCDFEILQFANSFWEFLPHLHKNVSQLLFTLRVVLLYVNRD